MRLSRMSMVIIGLTMLVTTACSGTAQTPPDTVPVMAADCAALPPAPEELNYAIERFTWVQQDQLEARGRLHNVPAGYGVWAFLRDEGVCYRFSFGPGNNLIGDNVSVREFSFGVTTRMPDVIKTLPADDGNYCPYEFAFNAATAVCEVTKTAGYDVVLVLANPSASAVLADYTPVPNRALPIDTFPAGTFTIAPDSLTTEGYVPGYSD